MTKNSKTHTHARAYLRARIHTRTHKRARTHAHMSTHKCAAGIDEIAEPDASAAVYPALFLASVIQQEKMITPLEAPDVWSPNLFFTQGK